MDISDEELLEQYKDVKAQEALVKEQVKALNGEIVKRARLNSPLPGKYKVEFGGRQITIEIPKNEKWNQDGLSALWERFGKFMKMELSVPAASLKLLDDVERAEILKHRIDTPGAPKVVLS